MKKDVMKDFNLNEVRVGDNVAFICNKPNEKGFLRSSIQVGTIEKATGKGVSIYCEAWKRFIEKDFHWKPC